jgi:Coenzyme PQQ synthesis protein D (PqqD)
VAPAYDVRLYRRPDVLMQVTADGAVLVDPRSGVCFELNRTGAELWELLASGATVTSICAALAARYDVSTETIADDVNAIVDRLKQQKLVATSTAPEGKT